MGTPILRTSHREYRLCVVCCCATMVMAFSACSQRWAFMPSSNPDAMVRPLHLTSAKTVQPLAAVAATTPSVVTSMLGESAASRVPQAYPVTEAVYGQPIVDADYGDEYCHPLAGDCPTFSERFCASADRGWCDVKCDYHQYYSCRTGRDLLLCVGAAAIMANTSIDQNFRDWVQDDVRSSDLDDFASFWKAFGEGKIFIPAWAGLALVGSILDEYPAMGTVGDFSYRTTRSYLVGVPPMLFMQYCLGAARPEEGSGAQWHPFSDDNGVSGHAFVGAVPFITAAQMSDNCYMKGCCYFMSTLTGWSRINDDSHYLSQVWMGWWMAYLSCRAVSETEDGKRCCYSVAPIMSPDTVGMMFEYRR